MFVRKFIDNVALHVQRDGKVFTSEEAPNRKHQLEYSHDSSGFMKCIKSIARPEISRDENLENLEN